MQTDMNMAVRVAETLLGQDSSPSEDDVRSAAESAVLAMSQRGKDIDVELLTRELQSMYAVFVADATSLEDDRDHVEWLSEKRSRIEWKFWERYRRYLEDRLPPTAVNSLDEVTDDILRKLEDPSREGRWDRRGMIVGQVQSGKTANYTGLICKAADAGYSLIVVLAGSHNSLRSQTQSRLDEGFLGFDTRQRMRFDRDSDGWIGVGRLPGHGRHVAHSLTNSLDNGDFKRSAAAQMGLRIGGREPIVLVVKKNATILKNLIRWTTAIGATGDTGTVTDVPLLLIDDEADNASVNTRAVPTDEDGNIDEDYRPARINSQIRELLRSFQQTAYIGYTATPFANIFIPLDQDAATFGEDLFPRSFIINLPTPSNHMGPAEVFGLTEGEPTDGMPIIRTIDDQDNWVPDRHRNHHRVGSPPESLQKAMRAFVLVCAARMVRGQDKVHNSMLVHVTRYTSVQAQVAQQIREELTSIRNRLRYGDGDLSPNLLEEMRALWEEDFVPTSLQMYESEESPTLWHEVENRLVEASSRIEVLEINGTARDVLEYSEHRDGFSCIAVGGDKLSRGLTLEGLSVSYYLRASRMYDTLMQMGRWFGYRHGYEDLCRLYTTGDLVSWYREITAASEELRQEFDRMAAAGRTPKDYGLLVRQHSGALLVTAPAKMRAGTRIQITFSGQIPETVVFERDKDKLNSNLEALNVLVRSIGEPENRERGTKIWRKVDPEDILTFLDSYSTHREAHRVQASLLTRYIRSRLQDDELTEWTVVMASGQSRSTARIAGHLTKLVKRRALAPNDSPTYRIRRVVSPSDEIRDLSEQEQEEAIRLTNQRPNSTHEARNNNSLPAGSDIRQARPSQRGLLIIYPLDPGPANLQDTTSAIVGFAVSFPHSEKPLPVIEYVVNETYWEQEFGFEGD